MNTMLITNTILELLKLDISTIIMGSFIIMSSAIAMFEIIGKFSNIIGKPVKWVKERENVKELTLRNTNDIKNLAKKQEEDTQQSIRHDEIIRNDLKKLTKMFIDKEIDDWRWEILDMASALSGGKQYNKEQFEHVLSIHERYEKLLEENNMSNGQVDVSISIIKDIYKEKLKNGF